MRKFIFILLASIVSVSPICAQLLNVTAPYTELKNAYTIENDSYSVGFAENYGIPIWSFYKFTSGMASGSSAAKEEWQVDSRVKGYKITPKDLANLNQEPVQLFPKEHASNASMVVQSTFLTSNILFMPKQLKDSIWQRLTESFENIAKKSGIVYIFSGPIFEKDSFKIKYTLNNHVAVPIAFYRIALYVEDGKAVYKCYRFPNRIPTDYERNCDLEDFSYNLYQLEADTGIDFLDRDIDKNFRQEKMEYLEKRIK